MRLILTMLLCLVPLIARADVVPDNTTYVDEVGQLKGLAKCKGWTFVLVEMGPSGEKHAVVEIVKDGKTLKSLHWSRRRTLYATQATPPASDKDLTLAWLKAQKPLLTYQGRAFPSGGYVSNDELGQTRKRTLDVVVEIVEQPKLALVVKRANVKAFDKDGKELSQRDKPAEGDSQRGPLLMILMGIAGAAGLALRLRAGLI